MIIRGMLAFTLATTSSVAFAQSDPSIVARAEPQSNTVATALSPDRSIQVSVFIDNKGRAAYSITRGGKPVLNESRLGFLLTDAPKLDGNFSILGKVSAVKDETWTQPFGEWKTIRDNHTELTVRLGEVTKLHREIDVTFRIFNNGVGFRYSIPAQQNLARTNIGEELTEFAFAQDGKAWWKPGLGIEREEYLYQTTALDQVGLAQTVFTTKLADGTHVALHEAAIVDFPAMNLLHVGGNTLKASLTPGSGAPAAVKIGAFNTPWRTIAISDDAPGLYENHIELNLNEPNKLGDVSWIKPGKFVGVWWNMIIGKWTWAEGPKHGAKTPIVKQYIDFAAANRISGVLVEGWNVGWNGDWAGNGNAMEFDKPTADFNADELARYAKAKGVYLIGHNETGGSASHYDDQLERAMKFAADHGEPVIKTGYVSEANQIERVDPDGSKHREWHEGQWMSNHYLRVVTTAAKYHISIDSHEPIKDSGLRRTYPNWISREGGRGMEYNSWAGKNPPEHEANMFFTQWLGGPMDFTPGVLSLTGSDGSAILSTEAKQLALYVVVYSPVTMAADTPENYAKHMNAFKFIRDVPVDWSDTRVLNGEVGDYVTVARKDRASDNWYLGSITDENARTLTVKLDFLDPKRRYTAEIYRDGPDADYRTDNRHAIVIEKRKVKRGVEMTFALAPGGGQAVRFVAGR